MRFEDLNWMDVENYLRADDRLMLVTGACEQHGYLSLLTDIRIPLSLATAAAQRAHVPIAPPLNFGISPYFTAYPGTISLRTETFLAVLADLVRGVHAQGFRRVLVLNGHGGNTAGRGRLSELSNELHGLRLDWYDWWTSPAANAVAQAAGLPPNHANWLEAFPFCRVADLPEGEKATVELPLVTSAAEARKLLGDGVYGGPYSAPDEVMQRLFDACVDEIVARLKFA
jgi:creatinine amidohydrolase